METRSTLGTNRTGAAMSPMDVSKMAEYSDSTPPTPTDDSIEHIRGMAIAQSDGVGSVPMPATATGMATTGVDKLMGQRPEVLVDKLGERLAFERMGTRLYEAMIMKLEQSLQATDSSMLDELRHIRDEEAQHFTLLSDALKSIGADPTAQTPSANVAAVMSSGIMQVVTDPRTNLAQSLNALLVAELADNASWELLIQLADGAGNDELVPGFLLAAQHEAEHLASIKSMLEQQLAAESGVGGEGLVDPTH